MLEQALKLLRLPREVDMEAVRKAYIKQTRRYPPEHFPEKFKRIKQAYEQLRLEQSVLKPMADQFARAQSSDEIFRILFEEALLDAGTKHHEDQLSEQDFEQLETLFKADWYERQVKQALEEIGAEMQSGSEG